MAINSINNLRPIEPVQNSQVRHMYCRWQEINPVIIQDPAMLEKLLGIEWLGACQDIHPKQHTRYCTWCLFSIKKEHKLVRPIQVLYTALWNTAMSHLLGDVDDCQLLTRARERRSCNRYRLCFPLGHFWHLYIIPHHWQQSVDSQSSIW